MKNIFKICLLAKTTPIIQALFYLRKIRLSIQKCFVAAQKSTKTSAVDVNT